MWRQPFHKVCNLCIISFSNTCDDKAYDDTHRRTAEQVGEVVEAEEDPAEGNKNGPRKQKGDDFSVII